MKIATTKQRIIQYLENKGIALRDFYATTGLKRGLLDSDKLHQSITDKNLATIIASFDDINLHWLLTGDGPMLRSDKPPEPTAPSVAYARDPRDIETIALQRQLLNAYQQGYSPGG